MNEFYQGMQPYIGQALGSIGDAVLDVQAMKLNNMVEMARLKHQDKREQRNFEWESQLIDKRADAQVRAQDQIHQLKYKYLPEEQAYNDAIFESTLDQQGQLNELNFDYKMREFEEIDKPKILLKGQQDVRVYQGKADLSATVGQALDLFKPYYGQNEYVDNTILALQNMDPGQKGPWVDDLMSKNLSIIRDMSQSENIAGRNEQELQNKMVFESYEQGIENAQMVADKQTDALFKQLSYDAKRFLTVGDQTKAVGALAELKSHADGLKGIFGKETVAYKQLMGQIEEIEKNMGEDLIAQANRLSNDAGTTSKIQSFYEEALAPQAMQFGIAPDLAGNSSWAQAKNILKVRYKDNSEFLKYLDAYDKSPYSQFRMFDSIALANSMKNSMQLVNMGPKVDKDPENPWEGFDDSLIQSLIKSVEE
jgi:hypothetical protein